MKKHIAIVNIPAHGHVNPTLAVVKELVNRGYRVTYVTTEEFKPAIEAAGATPLLYRSVFSGDLRPKKTYKEVQLTSPRVLLKFLEEMKVGLPQLEELYKNDKPDLVLHDYLAWSAKVFAIKRGIPYIQLNPTFVENEHFSMDKRVAKVHPFHPAIIKFMIELMIFLKKQKTKDLTIGKFFNDLEKKCIAFFPRAFQYEGETFNERFFFVGPCLDERQFQGNWQPPADNRPILLISFGTASKAEIDFFKTCIDTFADSTWHIVMSIGKHIDPSSLGTLPSNFDVRPQVPQLAILPHCKAFISHGGMNSTMEAMYHGVPLVVVPQTKEQEAIANRVNDLGIGVYLPHEKVTKEALWETVQRVANNQEIRTRVQDMRQKVHEAGGSVKAADVIEESLR